MTATTTGPRFFGTLAAVALLLTCLTACGGQHSSGGATGNYCADLTSGQRAFSDFTSNTLSTSSFDDLLSRVDGIRDEAPADVKTAWTTFDAALHTFQAALKSAGLSMSDVVNMQSGGMAGMSGAAMQRAMHAGSALNSPAFLNATHSIQVEVQSHCQLDFGG